MASIFVLPFCWFDSPSRLSVTHNPIDTLLDSDPYSGSLAQCWLSQKYAYLAFFQVQGQTFIGQYGNYSSTFPSLILFSLLVRCKLFCDSSQILNLTSTSVPTEFGTPTLGLFLGVAPSFEFAKVLIFNSSNCLTLIHVNAAENPDRVCLAPIAIFCRALSLFYMRNEQPKGRGK